MLQEAKITEERNSNGENDPDHLSEEEREAMGKPETMIVSNIFVCLIGSLYELMRVPLGILLHFHE